MGSAYTQYSIDLRGAIQRNILKSAVSHNSHLGTGLGFRGGFLSNYHFGNTHGIIAIWEQVWGFGEGSCLTTISGIHMV